MTPERVSSSSCIFAFKQELEPAIRVQPGSVLILETRDCFSGQLKSSGDEIADMDWSRINPATGPVFLEGACPGDILKIEIKDIRLKSPAVMIAAPGEGVLGDRIEKPVTKILPLTDNRIEFSPDRVYQQEPMVGVMGVAPAGEEEIPTGHPGPHGGNMDCRLLQAGSILYLPVNTPGALLAAGDMHALMGDGEIVVCAGEAGGELEMSLDLVKGSNLPVPLLENSRVISTIASAETLDEAVNRAVYKMTDLLIDYFNFTLSEAGMLLSLIGQAEICQVVDPLKTARFTLAREEINLKRWQSLTNPA